MYLLTFLNCNDIILINEKLTASSALLLSLYHSILSLCLLHQWTPFCSIQVKQRLRQLTNCISDSFLGWRKLSSFLHVDIVYQHTQAKIKVESNSNCKYKSFSLYCEWFLPLESAKEFFHVIQSSEELQMKQQSVALFIGLTELRKMQIQRSNRIRDCYKNQFNGKIQFLTY